MVWPTRLENAQRFPSSLSLTFTVSPVLGKCASTFQTGSPRKMPPSDTVYFASPRAAALR